MLLLQNKTCLKQGSSIQKPHSLTVVMEAAASVQHQGHVSDLESVSSDFMQQACYCILFLISAGHCSRRLCVAAPPPQGSPTLSDVENN